MIPIKLVIIFGFSKGWAEFAPKKPPPFVPKSLMISKDATGPVAIYWVLPSKVSTNKGAERVCGTPWAKNTIAPMIEIGSNIRVIPRIKST